MSDEPPLPEVPVTPTADKKDSRQRPSFTRRALRWLTLTILVLGSLLTLAGAGAWWWSGTEGSLATALRWLQQPGPLALRLPPVLQALRFQEVSGTLRHGGRVGQLRWQSQGLTASATGLELRWQLRPLLSNRLQLDRLHMASLSLERGATSAAGPAGPPQSLQLPIAVTLSAISIDQFSFAGKPALEASGLRGSYRYSGRQHQLEVSDITLAEGRYAGHVHLAADGAMALDAAATGRLSGRVPGSSETLPLSLRVSAQGLLQGFELKAALQLDQAAGPRSGKALPPSATPQARVSARVTPWAAQVLTQAEASFSQLDLALLWPKAPQTRLTGTAQVQPQGDQRWSLALALKNAMPGPWDQQRLPLEQMAAEGEWRGAQVLLKSLDVSLGQARVQASGQWTAPPAKAASGPARPSLASQDWQLQAQLEQINPAALDSRLAAQRLTGTLALQSSRPPAGEQLSFDAALQAEGGQALQPLSVAASVAPAWLQWLAALQLRQASASGVWHPRPGGGTLDLSALQVRAPGAELQASGQFQTDSPGGEGRLSLSAPGLSIVASGALRLQTGAGQLAVKADDAQRALRWLRGLPGLTAPLDLRAVQGRGQLQLAWQGGWQDPQLQATLNLPTLDWPSAAAHPGTAAPTAAVRLREVQLGLNGRLSQARLTAQGQALAGSQRITLQLVADGGASTPAGPAGPTQPASPGQSPGGSLPPWQAVVQQLTLSLAGAASAGSGSGSGSGWQIKAQSPFSVRGAAALLEIGAGTADLQPPAPAPGQPGAAKRSALLTWQSLRWTPDELATAGSLKGLPVAWAQTLLGPQFMPPGWDGPVLLDGDWDAVIGARLKLRAQLARRTGDISLQAESAQGVPTRIAAGIREARITLDADGPVVNARLRWDSERAGTAEASLRTELQRVPDSGPDPDDGPTLAGWRWPAKAAISGQLNTQLPRLAAWSVLAPTGWRLRGSLASQLSLAGTRDAPQVTGDLRADDLALRSVVDGIEWGEGRLRARFDGERLLISEFSLQGAGPKGSGGTLQASGQAAWVSGAPQVTLSAKLDRLRASVRNDRQITVSGELEAKLAGPSAEINGTLRVDKALLILPDESLPQLGEDVVLRGTPAKTMPLQPAREARTTRIAVQIDLGQDFRIEGKGVDTRMRGVLALLGDSTSKPRLYGTLTTAGGQYRAYGQRLDIEDGVLRFGGPIDNPTLDVLAVRPNLSQRVGVQITGTALLPRVRLYAEPELPDAEKLSWLVLGRSSASGGAEAALLQQAALALIGSRNGNRDGNRDGSVTSMLANSLGLDELSLRAPSGSGDTASPGAITLGKRFSSNFYAAYERSLSGTLGTLYLFYELSQRFTVRAQSGEQTAIDLIFTVPYE
jgi:translocation and assembly module TamB